MIQKVKGNEYASILARIYNSANELYPENERYPADESVFYKQLQKDENYIYETNGEIVGFMSYHQYENYYELTSLYIDIANQKQGIGEEFLHFFESHIPTGSFVIVKALNSSPWAIRFYTKHGYENAAEAQLRNINVEQHNWESVLCKTIHKTPMPHIFSVGVS